MEIRRLTKADLPSLLRLYGQLDAQDPQLSAEMADAVWAQIETQGSIVYLGAVEDGAVVSTCYVAIIPNLTRGARPIAFVENVVTDAAHRRQGLGRRVLNEAVHIAREAGCYKVMLASGAGRTQAHAFYESLGFDGQSKRAFDLRLPEDARDG